jgi:CDP-diacylglycerol--serine O-phosphatidyltransferase
MKSKIKSNRYIRHLPNLITLLNMLLGISVIFIVISQQGEVHRLTACGMILASVVLDCFDGKIARALNVESILGKQLDSFADLISFGLAPMAILLTHGSFRSLGWIMYAFIAIYTIAAAYRLARFNLGDFTDFFLGLPITVAGLILTLTNAVLHFYDVNSHPFHTIPVIILILILSILMVSNIKINRL